MPHTKDPRRRTRAKPKPRSAQHEHEIEKLVQAGVERFMLKNASIYDFLKMIRSATKRETTSPHPLTGEVFSRIVKAAIKKRKRQASGKKHSDSQRRN